MKPSIQINAITASDINLTFVNMIVAGTVTAIIAWVTSIAVV